MGSKPVIYIAGPGYSYVHFEPLISLIGAHFDQILRTIKLTRPDGKVIDIELHVEASGDSNIASAKARRVSEDPAVYEIRMTTGLSYQVWLASRALAGEVDFLTWIKQIKLRGSDARKQGRKELLADFAYFIGSYYILLHEISHVILGHCDYIIDEMGMDWLDESDDPRQKLTTEQIRIRRAFEVEADRQAGELLSVFFDSSLEGDRRQLAFPSIRHAYEFYVLAITLVFVLLQQRHPAGGLIHPPAYERQYVLVASLSKYLKLRYSGFDDYLMHKVLMDAMRAGEKVGLMGSSSVESVLAGAFGLTFVDDVVRETGIRGYQHKWSLR